MEERVSVFPFLPLKFWAKYYLPEEVKIIKNNFKALCGYRKKNAKDKKQYENDF